ncbi:PREDICTED: spermatogenesis-associated protein 7 homolog [Aptenodytes forsteri]|uniref:spermatogenesis-associated protein 7 homolog n=1 Tax=Aptenodytes forsteri TaxID=9233 RepID=UPI0009051F49|nr:PREDICTED: spermatogenesis-associated protein 7 homolog [Aptenodytes forsteri]
MVPTYSMMGPFRGHMSLKSSPFSPRPSCKLSNQYIIQAHMAAHYKKLMSAKAAVDTSAPKSLHTSVKYKDQQKRDRLIQALVKYKKDLVHGLPASPFNSKSVSPSQRKAGWSLLENGHLYLMSGRNNCSRTKREQPRSVSFQKLTSRTLMPTPTARKTIRNTGQHALSQPPVHNSSTDRSSASPLLQSRMHLCSRNRKKAFQNSFNKTYSGDLLDKHSIYFTEKKQRFTPQILNTSHQSFLVKHRYYNPPPQKKSSSPGRPSFKSADINNENKRELHRFLEDAHVRPHSDHFSPQPVENHELWIPDSKMPLSPGSQLEESEEEYLRFLQDLTNAILIRSCYHEEVLEDVFQMHIKSKRHNLDEVKKRRIVESLKKELNITDQPDPAISCKGARQKDASISATCF